MTGVHPTFPKVICEIFFCDRRGSRWRVQMIGRVLKGKYRILAVVGRGGVATVYLGRDVTSDRTVAVKVLKEEYTEHPEFPERFRREAEAVLHLDDPHIVEFLDYGIEDGRHFLVMEYIEGKTLAQVVRERGPLPIEEAIGIACQVCDALEVAHEGGVVHRDIKPQNLMLTPEGAIKVMDFGLARVATEVTLTQTGVFMGTPRYVSPEVVKGERVDHRGDIYALGVVLYEMLTGDIPFLTDSTWALLQAHVQEQPPPVREARREVPEWLEAVIDVALAKDPEDRFQTAAAFRAALEGKVAEGSLDAPTLVMEMPMLPMARVDRRWVAAAALGMVLLFAAGAFWAMRSGWLIPASGPGGSPVPVTKVAVVATATASAPGASASTATPTVEPTTTHAPTPRPTSTATSPPPPTQPTPSPTPAPTDTPTSAATRTPTPTSRPTSTPTTAWRAPPVPVYPRQDTVWLGESVEFAWDWEGTLAGEEFFELRIVPSGGDPAQPLFRDWATEPVLSVDLSDFPAAPYAWGVWVVRGQATATGVSVTEVVIAPQALQTFQWEPPTPSPTPPPPKPQPSSTATRTPKPTKRPTNTPQPTWQPTRTPTSRPPTKVPTPLPTATPQPTGIPITPPPLPPWSS